MSRYDQVDLAYTFLAAKENAGESFTIEELAIATDWKKQTCGTYPSKTVAPIRSKGWFTLSDIRN